MCCVCVCVCVCVRVRVKLLVIVRCGVGLGVVLCLRSVWVRTAISVITQPAVAARYQCDVALDVAVAPLRRRDSVRVARVVPAATGYAYRIQALGAINESSGRSWVTMQRFPDNILTGKPCVPRPSTVPRLVLAFIFNALCSTRQTATHATSTDVQASWLAVGGLCEHS